MLSVGFGFFMEVTVDEAPSVIDKRVKHLTE